LQPDLFDEPGIELSDEVKDQLEDEIEDKSHVRKKYPVRCALPKDLPRERVVHDIPVNEKVCECGSPLVHIGEEITEQLKYIPAQ
jgi:transposase